MLLLTANSVSFEQFLTKNENLFSKD